MSKGARLIGRHPSIAELERTIDNLGGLDATVLILGESGTGKELVARSIHERSGRRDQPFVGVNCGAFARGLLEDQLFGHVRGAFTGALEDKPGLFQEAGRGTLFLDEIAELDVDLQGRLLRALQEREVVPLGSNRPERWEGRLLAATNQDLDRLIGEGLFRKDLYYRINVIQVRLPSLRERIEDVPALAEHFLEQFGRASGRRKCLSQTALDRLLGYDYPGNVRELRNALERACALGLSDSVLPEDLPAEFRQAPSPGFKSLAAVEREHILSALRLAGGRKTLAAKYLQIDRNRLNRMIKRHGIPAERPAEQ